MKKVRRILFVLLLFVGIGAMFGGLVAIMKPENPLGISTDALKNSPFDNYLIPGILLFGVIGIGSFMSALVLLVKSRLDGYVCSIFSWALVGWIIVQCIMLNAITFLHVLYFIIGFVEAMLSMSLLFERRMFPANVLLNIYNRIKK